MADQLTGFLRASLGQGLGMGWGDELEAKYLSDLPYEQALQKIRQEYAQYSKESPVASTVAEFAGGMAPAVGMMFVPGAQAAGAAQAARSTGGALARLAGLGAATGAVSGAGSATEGDRTSGATSGGLVGGTLGLAVPIGMRSATGGAKWLRERLAPSEASAKQRAEQMLYDAVVKRSKMTPQQMESAMNKDRAMGVPSVLANLSPATARLTRGVAKVGSEGADTIEDVLGKQKFGARERAYSQVKKGLQPGDYYADEAKLVQDLRSKAGTMYDEAYAWGDVDDPKITRALGRPELQSAYKTARDIADAQKSLAIIRGEDPSKFDLPEIYKPTGKFTDSGAEVLELTKLPDVRTLDFMKRALDAQINAGYASDNAAVKANTATLKEIRNELRDTLKDSVPPYKKALSEYAGDMEVIDAMRAGMNDFGKLDHEQVISMLSKMGNAEKTAFRTGVARDLYATVMRPSNEPDAARRIIGSPEMQLKLQPLFDDPAQFNLFKNALERESVLFKNASRILGGSDTAENLAIKESLSGSGSLFDALDRAATGGNFTNSLAGLALTALSKGQMTSKTADKLSDMLMAKNPAEVAAVVKFLEQHAAGLAPKAVKNTAAERGAVMGSTSTVWPAPQIESGQRGGMGGDIEQDIQTDEAFPASAPGPDIEADIEADLKPK
jgi:hypothetical protein